MQPLSMPMIVICNKAATVSPQALRSPLHCQCGNIVPLCVCMCALMLPTDNDVTKHKLSWRTCAARHYQHLLQQYCHTKKKKTRFCNKAMKITAGTFERRLSAQMPKHLLTHKRHVDAYVASTLYVLPLCIRVSVYAIGALYSSTGSACVRTPCCWTQSSQRRGTQVPQNH